MESEVLSRPGIDPSEPGDPRMARVASFQRVLQPTPRPGAQAEPDEIEIVGEKLEDLTVKDFKVPSAAILNLIPRFLVNALAPLVWVKPIILSEKCTKCGFCVESCPTSSLFVENKSVPDFNYKLCINCLCCHEVCPENAVDIETSRLAKRWIG